MLIPYYNICDALKYSTINGKQLYFNFSNNGHSSMLIYDIKLSSLYVRGSTYLFTTRMFKDVHTTGVYSGLVFDSSNLFKYAIMTKFVANSNSKEINNEIYDTWLDTKYTFNDKLGSRNKNNGALNIFKGAWFEFSAETKEKRFLNYNSLWFVDWYITLVYYNNTEIDIVKYLREENNILTGIHNLNNKEYEPVLTDMISLNKGVVSNDGSGILSFESEMNKCNSLSSNSFHIRNISHIYYFSIFSFLLLFQ